MDMTEQAVGNVAFAGDIAKVQHGMHFVDVDYFYFVEDQFDAISSVTKHCPASRPFFTIGNKQLQTGYPEQSCIWDIDSQMVEFGQVADGSAEDTSACMRCYYDLKTSYFPNYAGADDRANAFVQTCKYIDLSKLNEDLDAYVSVSAVQHVLKSTAGFSRTGYRISAWSTLPEPNAPNDLTAPGQSVTMTSDMSCYAIWIQQCNVQLNCFPSICKAEILSPMPINDRYDLGATLELKAFPAEWYTFDCWKIGSQTIAGELASYELSSVNTNIEAYFSPTKYKLNIVFSTLQGSIRCKDGDAEQTITMNHEIEVTHFSKLILTAQDRIGSIFNVWKSDDIAVGDPTSKALIVDSISKDITVSADFQRNSSSVNVIRNNKNFGTVWISSAVSGLTESDYCAVMPGDSAMLSAVPADYCQFVKWKTATSEITDISCKIDSITQPANVSAYFDTWLVANDYEQPIIYVSSDISGNIDDCQTT